jgi:hypothetical protein
MSPASRICCRASSRVRGTASSARRSPLAFSSSPRRALVERARDDDVGRDQQHVLGATGQDRIAADVVAELRLPAATRKPAQSRDLLGIGQRQHQLIVQTFIDTRRGRPARDARAAGNASATREPKLRTAAASEIRPRHDHGLALEFRAIGEIRKRPPSPAPRAPPPASPCDTSGPHAAPARGRQSARRTRDHASPR